MTARLATRSPCPKDSSSRCAINAIKIDGSERTRSELLSRRPPLKRQLLRRLLLLQLLARDDLHHVEGLTKLRRMLQRPKTLQSQPRLRDDVRAAASQKSSLRSRERSHLRNRHLQASLAAGASNRATGTAPRPTTRNAPCPRNRTSLPTRVVNVTTGIDVAQISKIMSRFDVTPHLPNPRPATE